MTRLLWLLSRRRARGRALLAVIGIALGVALGYGVHLVNRAAVEDLAASVRAMAGEADLQVRGGRTGFPESLYPQVARMPGVSRVHPGLELDVGLAGSERTIRIIGIDALRIGEPDLLKADRVLLSPLAAQTITGKTLPLVVGPKTVELQVAGTGSVKGFAALTDIATAQWRLGRLGELNRLDIFLAKHSDRDEILASIKSLLPPGVHIASVESLEQASATPSRAYRVNLNVLAMVALFTGGFLVFSAQALEVARRRGEHALLRVLGAKGAEISRLVLVEAAALGAIGGVAGVGLGYGLAHLAVRHVGADLGAGQLRGVVPVLDFSIALALLHAAAGI